MKSHGVRISYLRASVPVAAYAGTAASSPLPQDDRTPEPDIPAPITAPPIPFEEGMLEGVPLPIYPLPSKPFPVQPPIKIGMGVAPAISFDKGGRPVRRWRQVNREVRGIAGGRWFTRTWVGEKESEFASASAVPSAANVQMAQAAAERDRENTAATAAAAAGITLARPSALSGTVSGRQSGKSKALKADADPSAVHPSRIGSLIPETISAPTSKKRKSIPAASTLSADTPVILPS